MLLLRYSPDPDFPEEISTSSNTLINQKNTNNTRILYFLNQLFRRNSHISDCCGHRIFCTGKCILCFVQQASNSRCLFHLALLRLLILLLPRIAAVFQHFSGAFRVLQCCINLRLISYRAMMGEYILYYRDKIVGGIYDDRLLVKPVSSVISLMPTATYELPYEGAKEMLLVDDVDSREFLCNLFLSMYDELPAPKKKKTPSKK